MIATPAQLSRQDAQVMVLSAKQDQFLRSPTFIRGFVAGRGSGKTVIGARTVLLRCRDGEPWMSVSPSYGIIFETTMPTFIQEARQIGCYVRHIKSPLPRVIYRTQDGGTADIVFRSGDDPEKLRGPSKAGLWIDEASITAPEVFTIGMAVLRHKGQMGPVLLTFTPRGRRHWTFETFYQRVEIDHHCQLTADAEGGMELLRRDPDTGEVVHKTLHEFGGLWFVRRANTHLIHAHTLDNPFLPREFYDNIRAHYTSEMARQELAGEFVELGGLMFRREWFQLVKEVPLDCRRVRYWDRAATVDGGSYSVGTLMARDPSGLWYVEDVVRGQWSAWDRDEIIKQTASRDRLIYQNSVVVYVEQEGGSAGKEVSQQLRVMLAGVPVYADRVAGKRKKIVDHQVLPGEAKRARAQPFASQAEGHNVKVLEAAWNAEWFDELCSFPNSPHDDQVDSASGAFNKLAELTNFISDGAIRTRVASVEQAVEKYGQQFQRSRRGRELIPSLASKMRPSRR